MVYSQPHSAYTADGSGSEVHSPSPAEAIAEDPAWSSHQISPAQGSFPHLPNPSKQQKSPPGQRAAPHGDVQRPLCSPRVGSGTPCRVRSSAVGDASIPPSIFSSLTAISHSLVHTQDSIPTLPALISNAAHGAHHIGNGLNLKRQHFNYNCVRTESVV